MLNIAVLPGDGIGPEIISEAIKVLKAISEKRNIDFNSGEKVNQFKIGLLKNRIKSKNV